MSVIWTVCHKLLLIHNPHSFPSMGCNETPPHLPPQGGSHKAEQVLVWSGSKTQTNKKDGGKKRREFFFFSPWASVEKKNMPMNKRQSQVALLLWQQLHANQPFCGTLCCHLWQAHTYTHTRTVANNQHIPTTSLRYCDNSDHVAGKIAIILDETSIFCRALWIVRLF